jgi:hypothetical protein
VDPLPGLAEALVPLLKPHFEQPTDQREFYSQCDNPLGRRQHLEVARSGAVQSYKVGRLVLVRRDEMRRFIELHAMAAPRREDNETDILADWDLEPGSSE